LSVPAGFTLNGQAAPKYGGGQAAPQRGGGFTLNRLTVNGQVERAGASALMVSG